MERLTTLLREDGDARLAGAAGEITDATRVSFSGGCARGWSDRQHYIPRPSTPNPHDVACELPPTTPLVTGAIPPIPPMTGAVTGMVACPRWSSPLSTSAISCTSSRACATRPPCAPTVPGTRDWSVLAMAVAGGCRGRSVSCSREKRGRRQVRTGIRGIGRLADAVEQALGLVQQPACRFARRGCTRIECQGLTLSLRRLATHSAGSAPSP